MAGKESVIKAFGIPSEFGLLLLVFCFILLISPYLAGSDFGIFKVPKFSISSAKKLRIFGPVLFFFSILLFLPFLPIDETSDPSDETTDKQVHVLPLGFDFVKEANNAMWTNGTKTIDIFGYADDPDGFVNIVPFKRLENGQISKIFLETHPEWARFGRIEGEYGPFGFTQPAYIFCEIGFMYGAFGTDGANFKVEYKDLKGNERKILGEKMVTYDRTLDEFEVDLRSLIGRVGYIVLSVEAGKNAKQDWAVWNVAKVVEK